MKELLVRRSYALGTIVDERLKKRSYAKRNEFFQKALAYEKTKAKEGGILMPH